MSSMDKVVQGEIALKLVRRRFRRSNMPTGPENISLVLEVMDAADVSERKARAFLRAVSEEPCRASASARKSTSQTARA